MFTSIQNGVGQGAVSFTELQDWTNNNEPAIKYNSGTVLYKKTITVDPADDTINIDLGNPGFVAKVVVNGPHSAGGVTASLPLHKIAAAWFPIEIRDTSGIVT